MHYRNPIIRGFYPDPSICRVEDTYYLACSSFRYMPGIPLFESHDLINWSPIGHCITRTSQVDLRSDARRPGLFAPTLRHHDGHFYMTTTDVGGKWNLIVSTDDIHGEWSDPVIVEQGGIDPSLLFDDDHVYFLSNGVGDDGLKGIAMCEIDIATGERLTPSRTIWQGTGGRFLEGPHLYKINGMYYLLAAEGGTEYGHMVTYARSESPWGPFESYPGNPVLTNRDLGENILQGVGHGDLVDDNDGNWWMLHLGFRQINAHSQFHHLGRETLLTPVTFDSDGWFKAGDDHHPGAASLEVETDRIANSVQQIRTNRISSADAKWSEYWCTLRDPDRTRYQIITDGVAMSGSDTAPGMPGSPTMLATRQKEMDADFNCRLSLLRGEAGISLFVNDDHHHDLFAKRTEDGRITVGTRVCIEGLSAIVESETLEETEETITLQIAAYADRYVYTVVLDGNRKIELGESRTKYLSSEVSGDCFGVMIGLYSYNPKASGSDETTAIFSHVECEFLPDGRQAHQNG